MGVARRGRMPAMRRGGGRGTKGFTGMECHSQEKTADSGQSEGLGTRRKPGLETKGRKALA